MKNYNLSIATRKKPNKIFNEDLVGFSNNMYWLLDGATIPENQEILNGCDAVWLVKQISYHLNINSLNSEEKSLEEILEISLKGVQNDFFTKTALTMEQTKNHYIPSATLVLIRVLDNYIEYLVLGDSTLLIETDLSFVEITDKRLKSVAIDERKAIVDLVATGISYNHKNVHELHKKLVAKEQALLNVEGGYWMSSIEPNASKHALYGKIGFSRNARIALLSDGLTRAYTHFPICDSWESLLNYLKIYGVESCILKVRDYENEDSTGITYKRTKSSDDASGLYLEIT